MDSAKAKQAKSKAKARTKQKSGGDAATATAALALQQHAMHSPGGQPGMIRPEIQAAQIAMQTPTVNPYHMMGAMPPNYYNPGNVIGGGYTS